MILVDFNGIGIASIFASKREVGEVSEGIIRHFILNSLRAVRKKFSNKYGELIICCDGPNSWRKTVFPHYKSNRKKDNKDEWNEVYRILNQVRDELKLIFPYKVLHIENVEGDDIIAHLAITSPENNILIVANDKDLLQLKSINGLDVYSPLKDKLMECEREHVFTKDKVKHKNIIKQTPQEYLIEHIIRGDSTDGIPNIRSDGDTFVIEGKCQHSIERKFLEEFNISNIPEELKENWNRNKLLISLFDIPEYIKEKIQKEYDNVVVTGDRKFLFEYFVRNKLAALTDQIQDF